MYALKDLVEHLLECDGDPNCPNEADQTTLQSLCSVPGNDEVRVAVMILLLNWTRNGDKVSINHVDVDGNAALHYAARSGLLLCIMRLLKEGAIISLVNKDQMTCCEVADAANYKSIASMLEAALVFQPVDELSSAYTLELDQQLEAFRRNRPQSIVLDSQSMQAQDLSDWIVRAKRLVESVTGLDSGRVLAVLVGYDWNVSLALKDFVENPEAALRAAQLTASGGDEVVTAVGLHTPRVASPPLRPPPPPTPMDVAILDDNAINLDDLTFEDDGDGNPDAFVDLDELRAVIIEILLSLSFVSFVAYKFSFAEMPAGRSSR
jgi:hypothetical protein